MLSIHFLLELTAIYLIGVKLLNIPLKHSLRWIIVIIAVVLLIFDIQRFINQNFVFFEFRNDIYIYSGLAIATFLITISNKMDSFIVILLHVFNNFLITLVAGLFIIPADLTIREFMVNPIYLNIVRIIAISLILVVLHFFKKKELTLSTNRLSWKKSLFIIMTLFGFGYYVGFLQQYGQYHVNIMGQFANFIATLSGFLIISIVITLMLKDHQLARASNEKLMQEELIESQKRYHLAYLEQEEETQKFRHDIQNHFIILESFLNIKEYDKVEDYVKKLINRNYEISEYLCQNTGSIAVNAILFNLKQKYNTSKVKVEWSGILPTQSAINEKDLATIFMNMLENAYRASSEVHDESTIFVDIATEKTYLKICIANKFKEVKQSKNGGFMSTKIDADSSGYGLNIIENIVTKYGGEQKIEINDKKFRYEIIFLF